MTKQYPKHVWSLKEKKIQTHPKPIYLKLKPIPLGVGWGG